MSDASDVRFMREAIAEGERGRLNAPPNPWVGCVIVKDGEIIGRGYHARPGDPHAEVMALREAGEQARGATLYVTLEPCCHQGRTPPCTDAVIRSGVRRVVVGIPDPDAHVSGQGIAILKKHGIQVDTPCALDEVQQSLRPYLHHRQHAQPFCIAKAATSIDGRLACQDGSSQWISCETARTDAHRLRAQSQAILIGIGTALQDKPQLTVRLSDAPEKPPLRVVVDSGGRLTPDHPLLCTEVAPTLIATTDACALDVRRQWESQGAETLVLPATPVGRVDLCALMSVLAARGVLQLLAEGGGKLLSDLWAHKLIQQLSLYIGPRIIGAQGVPLFPEFHAHGMSDAPILQLTKTHSLGQTVRLDFIPASS